MNGGIKNWKHALSMFQKHETTQCHKDSVLFWHSYKVSKSADSVLQQIETASSSEITERREYLKRIVEVTSMLGKQGIPFRGHDESPESNNRGNFLECMDLLKKFDPFLQSYTPPANTSYLSSDTQNQMIQCCSQEVHSNYNSCHSVRYVADGALRERLLSLTDLKYFDAASICTAIENQLLVNNIDYLRCVAQTYDGAAVMSGALGGVQAHFRKKHPEAI